VIDTPILFIVFNRPKQTKKVFESIKSAKPNQLYIAADGARKNNITDIRNCKLVREIIKNIDWECNVKYLISDENLGCKLAVSGAINWFFKNVEEGIILEDDCLPIDGFYNFCSTLLEKYRNDKEVMHIGGTNFQLNNSDSNQSYYFSRITHIWGWATWRRAWEKYDVNIKTYDTILLKEMFEKYAFNKQSFYYWLNAFNNVRKNKINTWDYQWTYAVWKENGLAINPNKNLVSNIGFDSDSTHTNKGGEIFGNLKTSNLENITHPLRKVVNSEADMYTFKKWYIKRTILKRILDRIYKND